MDPASLTVGALPTVVVPKSLSFEKVGDGVVKLVTQLTHALGKRIPCFSHPDPQKLLEKETLLQVEAEVIRDPELPKMMQALLQAVESDPGLQQEVAKVMQQSRQLTLSGNEAQSIEVDELIQENSGSGSGTQEAVTDNKVSGTIKIGKIQQTNRIRKLP